MDLGEINIKKYFRNLLLAAVFAVVFFAFADSADAAAVYYSVGQNTDSHETGAGNVTVSGTTATFTIAQTAINMGIGDVIDYDTDHKLCYISGKTSTSVWSCTNATGGTPTAANDVVVNSVSHAFSSLSAALPSGAGGAKTLLGNADLTVIDVQLNIPCYYDSGADATAVTIDGWTTDATRYIKIYTPSNTTTETNLSQRHSGKWNDNKYHLAVNRLRYGVIRFSVDYLKIEGLQIRQLATDRPVGIEVGHTTTSNLTEISNNIIQGSDSANADFGNYSAGIKMISDSTYAHAWNNIIYDFNSADNDGGSGIICSTAGGAQYIYNNTIYNNRHGISTYYRWTTITVKNNIVQSSVGADYFHTGLAPTIVSSNNISQDGTSWDVSFANRTVMFIDASREDFHLNSSDTAAKAAGVDLSGDPNLPIVNDIDGATRTGSWDVGADAFDAAYNPDITPPILTEVTPIVSPTADNTPDYVFTSSEAGVITYGGACTSVTNYANAGNNTITLDALLDGFYTGCTITVKDSELNVSTALVIDDFIIESGTPPVISNAAPLGAIAYGTTETALTLVTNENASCKYGTSAETPYATMENVFTTTGLKNHSVTAAGLQNGQTYHYYVRCADSYNNTNNSDYEITFYVDSLLVRQYITNTVHIAGGTYVEPYNANQADTEYILDGDISADSSGIIINASRIIINLNGHTITYNQIAPGVGIGSGDYGFADVAISNGSIVQGAAQSVGEAYGTGSNPIRFTGGTPYSYMIARVQIADIYARYGSKDVGGISLGSDNHIIENNTIEDTYEYGIVTDRHSGIAAIQCNGSHNIIRNNTIINTRQKGIGPGSYADVYGNNITIRSICTNSIGISTGDVGSKIHDNTIYGRGEHPIGIASGNDIIGNSHDNEVYNNTIDTQITRLGTEYGGGVYPADALTAIHDADNAVGIRCTTGTINGRFYNNTIVVHSDGDYMGTWSPDGRPVRISAKARGFMVGVRYNGQSMRIYNNTVTALDKDGTGYVAGIACDANAHNPSIYSFRPSPPEYSPNVVFDHNTITSNGMNIVVGDGYGPCSGSPLFIQNTLIKADNFPTYATYGSGLGGYYEGTGRFISNIYQNGAAETSLGMHFESLSNNVPDSGGSYKNKSITFGRLMSATVRDGSDALLPNARIRTYDQSNNFQNEALTDQNGEAQVIVLDYNLNNNGGTTASATPIRVDYKPHTINVHNLTTDQNLFTTLPDSSESAWDFLTSSGSYTLSDENGSITLDVPSENAYVWATPLADTTMPQTALSVPPGSYQDPQSISLICTDNVGCARTRYCMTTGCNPLTDFNQYSPPITISNTSILRYYSGDAAGNMEAVQEVVYTIGSTDTTPPDNPSGLSVS